MFVFDWAEDFFFSLQEMLNLWVLIYLCSYFPNTKNEAKLVPIHLGVYSWYFYIVLNSDMKEVPHCDESRENIIGISSGFKRFKATCSSLLAEWPITLMILF